MASHFQAAALIASPSYPNAVAWSDENLVAVASGHIVTILNPALLDGPRGLVSIPPIKPFQIGVVEREDLFTGYLLPTCLSCNTRPCVRSISWSHLGLGPNSGCLLAVCTTEGRVKLYHQPFSEFCAEWLEVADISDLLFDYLVHINFGEFDMISSNHFPVIVLGLHALEEAVKNSISDCPNKQRRHTVFWILGEGTLNKEQAAEDHIESGSESTWENTYASKGRKQRLPNSSGKIGTWFSALRDQSSYCKNKEDANGGCTPLSAKRVIVNSELASFPCTTFKKGSSVEVLKQNGDQRVWVSGNIERVNGSKVLVLFPDTMANGKQTEWIEFVMKPNKVKGSSVINGKTTDQDCLVPKIRVSMDVGNFSEQVFLAESSNLKEILSVGRAVEAWMHDRWVEGLFMGCDGQRLLVNLSGDSGHVTLDAQDVRLAPLWNGELKSWQVTVLNIEVEDLELLEDVDVKSKMLKEKSIRKCSSFPEFKGKHCKKRRDSGSLPLITAEQYSSRLMMLSSTVVAWSPTFQLSSKSNASHLNIWPRNCSLLAVGGKSGKISFWRIFEPECYSVEHREVSVDVMLVGLLEAHNTWVTAISWGMFGAGAKSRVILVTGCYDGSVRIWVAETEELICSSEFNCSPFSLLKEVIPTTSVPISVLSLNIPTQSLEKMLLAVGKGSGSLEVFICDISSRDFQTAGSYDAHDQIVSGVAWAFDGRCLYSCSQDNSMRSWIMHEGSLHEILIPSNSLGLSSSTDLPHAFDSCFGVAISPGNMVLAMARSFDVDLLNPMYQARCLKAAVEFFWIGGQQLEFSFDRYLGFDIEAFSCFSKGELAIWESNILWSLKMFDNVDKPLVLWDILAALLAFKHFSQDYVGHILVKWLSSWFVSCSMGSSTDEILLHAPHFLSKIHSRRLQLLNIICRRVMLSEMKAHILNNRQEELGGCDDGEDGQLSPWIELLISSERELRERLVAFSLGAVLSQKPSSNTSTLTGRYWLPFGVAQMEQWVAINHELVRNQTKLLASEVKGLDKRLSPMHEYAIEERCTFCSASVPFQSQEVAFCDGEKSSNGIGQSHKLERCAVSMQVCPTSALWFCLCCKRHTSKQAPWTLFTLPDFHIEPKSLEEYAAFQVPLRPLCTFCGILLQRLQPEFLLSASPV